MGNFVNKSKSRELYSYNINQPKNQDTIILKEKYGCDTYPEACFSEPRQPTNKERKVWVGIL
jgi:hypothetical protein